jgi:hypothetical protein
MNVKINGGDFLKYLTFWYNKTDDECVELATTNGNVDAEQAMLNMLERDFCTSVNNSVIEDLTNGKIR